MTFAFSTGLDSFLNPGEIGPMYPFSGNEWLFVLAGIVLWLLWHVGQILGENSDHTRATATYERIGLDRVMYYGGSADVPSDEEWELRERGRVQHPSAGEPSLELDEPPTHPPVPPGRANDT